MTPTKLVSRALLAALLAVSAPTAGSAAHETRFEKFGGFLGSDTETA